MIEESPPSPATQEAGEEAAEEASEEAEKEATEEAAEEAAEDDGRIAGYKQADFAHYVQCWQRDKDAYNQAYHAFMAEAQPDGTRDPRRVPIGLFVAQFQGPLL